MMGDIGGQTYWCNARVCAHSAKRKLVVNLATDGGNKRNGATLIAGSRWNDVGIEREVWKA